MTACAQRLVQDGQTGRDVADAHVERRRDMDAIAQDEGNHPPPRHALAQAAVGAFALPVAPTGTSGSLVSRSRTSSMVHSPPIPRIGEGATVFSY
jgi:hypothetical protein